MLRREPRGYAVVLSDMRMPGMAGSVFLREARRCAPTAVRMLLTGYADSDAAAAAVNDGQIFRYLTKPCDRHQLKQACVGALAHHRALVAERELLEQTLHGSIQALTDVLALASPAAFGRSARLKDLTAGLVRAAGAGDAWEIEVASMLVNLGRGHAAGGDGGEAARGRRAGAGRDRDGRPDPRRSPDGSWPTSRGWRASARSSPGTGAAIDAGELPEGARMLRIAVDFVALEAEGAETFLALETMRGRIGVYDPELLEIFARTVGVRTHSLEVAEIRLAGLEVGMRLVHDVRARDRRLLITRGHLVTPNCSTACTTSRPEPSSSRCAWCSRDHRRC